MYKRVENTIRHLEGRIRDMEISQTRADIQWPDVPILDREGVSSNFWVPGKGLTSKCGAPTKGLFKLSRHMPKIGLRTRKANLAHPLVTDSAAGGSPYKQERLTGSSNHAFMVKASEGRKGRETSTNAKANKPVKNSLVPTGDPPEQDDRKYDFLWEHAICCQMNIKMIFNEMLLLPANLAMCTMAYYILREGDDADANGYGCGPGGHNADVREWRIHSVEGEIDMRRLRGTTSRKALAYALEAPMEQQAQSYFEE